MKTTAERIAQLVIVEDDIIYVDGNQIGDADRPELVTRRAAKLRAIIVREIESQEPWHTNQSLRNVAAHLREKSHNVDFSNETRAAHVRAAAYLELAYAELFEVQ